MSAVSIAQLSLSPFDGGHPVRQVSPSDLLATPPRSIHPSSVVARVESGGLGRPSFVVVDCTEGRIPSALVLEYGDADAERTRSARVWRRAGGSGSAPLYRLSSDSSSGGYVTA